MFALLGRCLARKPWLFVLAWAAALAAGIAWDVATPRPPLADVGSFLPPDAPHNVAIQLVREAFPDVAARSQIVIVVHRATGLTAQDLGWLNNLAREAGRVTGRPVLSPALPFLDRRLVSRDRQAAMAVVNLPSNFLSPATVGLVEQVQTLLDPHRPAGLAVELTGTAGIGRDYAAATEKAVGATTWVTVVALLVILVVIYRSPVGAMVPLVSIGASVYLAFVVLAVMAKAGWPVSNIERIFAVVLLFGTGVDYALFWIARYRESLTDRPDFESAAVTASRFASPAVVASAATTIFGLSMMATAQLVPSQNAGKILAPVLVVSLVAALTLSPALARLPGAGLFWPMGLGERTNIGQRFIWPRLAAIVVRRPRTVLLVGLLVLGVPAAAAVRLTPRFDSLAELPPGSSCDRGFKILSQHFPPGQLFATELVLKFDRLPANEDLEAISRELTGCVAELSGVRGVYSLADPLGEGTGPRPALLDGLIRRAARRFYVSQALPVMRLEVLIEPPPFSPEAMALIGQVRSAAVGQAEAITRAGTRVEAMLAGFTPYIIDVRAVSGRDQARVMTLATLVIALIVLALVRDLPLTLFMLLATWLTYGATLTFSDFTLRHLLNEGGLDWKVRLIVFVIVVAVGQDYNIFLVSRLLTELGRGDERQATGRAIVATGSVISSCGLIMAATLGSLWAGGLSLLRQVGFTLAAGILIDTFFVRPLLLPSFFLAAGRARRHRPPAPAPAPPDSGPGIDLPRPGR